MGGLALIQTGDRVRIDLNTGSANILISEEELAERRKTLAAAGGYKYPASQTPWQEIQRSVVGQMSTGAILEGRRSISVSPRPRACRATTTDDGDRPDGFRPAGRPTPRQARARIPVTLRNRGGIHEMRMRPCWPKPVGRECTADRRRRGARSPVRRLLTSTRQQSIPLTNLRRGIMASNLTDLMGLPDDWRDGRFVGRIDRGEGPCPILVEKGQVYDMSRVAPPSPRCWRAERSRRRKARRWASWPG